MSTFPNPRPGQLDTAAVRERSAEEIDRLRVQDEAATLTLGLISDQPDPTRFQRILDVACGTGGWLIRMAKTYPSASILIGVDVSQNMLDYAREKAREEGVEDRVEFHLMDARHVLEFPVDFFDLVNQRFAMSYLRTWDWQKLLRELQRIVKPGGVIRLTEADFPNTSSSPALMQLTNLLVQAAYQAGHIFAPEQSGVSGEIARLLERYSDLQDIQSHVYTVEHRAGTPEGDLFIEDEKHIFRTALPFLQKWTRLSDDFDAVYKQMLNEMQQPDFVAGVQAVTAWGTKTR